MGNKKGALKETTFGLILAFLLFSTTLSWGQDNSTQQSLSVKEKNPKTAFLLSLAGTALPLAALVTGAAAAAHLHSIGLVGVLVGPSLGYFYGGLAWRGLLGIGIRTVGVALAIVAFSGFWNETWSPWFPGDSVDDENWKAGLLIGAGIMLGSAIWDLVAVKGAVHKRNLKMRDRTLAFAPLLNPRTKTVGIRICLSF